MLATTRKMEGIKKKNTDKYKTSILEDERPFFVCFFLWLGISLVLVLVFHFLLFSNLTLILYFLFLPQADMDSLEGNDTPKSSHKPFHQSHKPHTHHQLQEGAIRMARSFSRHTPSSPGHLTTAHLSSGAHVVMPLVWVSASSLGTFSWPVSI